MLIIEAATLNQQSYQLCRTCFISNFKFNQKYLVCCTYCCYSWFSKL